MTGSSPQNRPHYIINYTPPESTSSQGREFSPQLGRTPCGLQDCPLKPCTLLSHYFYVNRRRSQKPRSDGKVSRIREQTRQDHATRMLTRLKPEINNGLPKSPFQSKHEAVFKPLLHHYFTSLFDRLTRVFMPHIEPATRYKQVIPLVYGNPVVNISAIANSQSDRLMLSRGDGSDRTTQIIYGFTLKYLREKLNSIQPEDVDWLLLLVVALSGIELIFQRPQNLRMHRSAMQKLVGLKGGIHHLGANMSYVINTDRFIALCLGDYPTYRVPFPTLRPNRPVDKYGSRFKNLINSTPASSPSSNNFSRTIETLDMPAVALVLDQVHLLGLLEEQNIDLFTVTPLSGEQRAVIPYFLYLRDKASADNAEMHAYYHENRLLPMEEDTTEEIPASMSLPNHQTIHPEKRIHTISRCMLLAAHLIFYAKAYADYYSIMRPILATELVAVLKVKAVKDWNGHEDLLIWMLLATAVTPRFDEHVWVVAELRRWLWRKVERDGGELEEMYDNAVKTLGEYIWSERLFDEPLKDVKREVLAPVRGLSNKGAVIFV